MADTAAIAPPLSLVILPGLDGTGRLFGPLAAALPDWIAPDVVDYPVDRVAGYDELAATVGARLPTDCPFVLLGESFGGPLAMRVAAGRPAGLVGLVLCATFGTSPRPVLGPALRWLARPAVFRLHPFYRRARRWTSRDPAAVGTWAASVDVAARVRPDVMAARVRLALSVDARADLARCAVPVLYLRGTRDGVVPAGNVRRVRRVRPDVSVVDVATSHQVLQRRPAESAAAISAFAAPLAGRLGFHGGPEDPP